MYVGDDHRSWASDPPASEKLHFCARKLREAKGFSRDIDWGTHVVAGLIIEEIVGAILHAEAELAGMQEELDRLREALEKEWESEGSASAQRDRSDNK